MHKILQPEGWARPKGYSNGISASGESIFVAGQIGWNQDCEFESDDFVDQCRLALQNIVTVLKVANAGPEHITRMTWYVTDKQEYLNRGADLGQVYRDVIGKNFPVMSAVQVVALMEDQAQVEIEVTAIKPTQ
ncbi:MAG: enamine deaminase RidA (YjgF/YER057c/UK114 family) [Arenicella sp.]|jgi:enamine deaminase RidA (YjgF/YER057c/UK114 family)